MDFFSPRARGQKGEKNHFQCQEFEKNLRDRHKRLFHKSEQHKGKISSWERLKSPGSFSEKGLEKVE